MKDSGNGGKDQVDELDSQREGRKAKARVSLRPLCVWAVWGEGLTSVREGLPPSVELSKKCPAGNLHSGSLSWFQIDYIISTQCSFEQSIQSAGFTCSL